MPSTAVVTTLQAALSHHQAGRLKEAELLYRQILSVDPAQADALHLLGLIAQQAGQPEPAIDLIQRAINVSPNQATFHSNLGEVYRMTRHFKEAEASHRRALELDQKNPTFWYNLGTTLLESGRQADAAGVYQQGLQVDPNHLGMLNNLAAAMQHLGRLNDSVAAWERALAINPNDAVSLANIGNAYVLSGRLRDAENACRRAIAINPQFVGAHGNLGLALVRQGRYDEAMACWDHAVSLDNNDAKSHLNRAMLFLMQGNFERGWEENEWRWKCPDVPRFQFSQPQWDGSDLTDKTILLHPEQGFGDTLNFIRYAPMVRAKGGRVVLACPPELRGLMETVDGIDQIITESSQIPAFDVQCPLMTLPLVFRTNEQTIPRTVPYMSVAADRVETWRRKLQATGDGLRIGFAWAGRPTHLDDRNRSMKLAQMSPFAQVSGITWYSLQKGDAAKQLADAPAGMKIVDLASELKDFTDTAAMVSALDLVLSVDTAVVHVAGALGRPVWNLLAYVPDWRWMLNREDTPWYPSMKLVRQPKKEDWDSVIQRLVGDLRQFVASARQ